MEIKSNSLEFQALETNNVIKHYENYDEDSRLIKDKAHEIEFRTTTHVLDNLISSKANILDVGAGTGRYSFYYASKGNSVTALDIVPKHVNLMREKFKENKEMKINIDIGNATDLSRYSDESFDAVFCFGPLYHLSTQQERNKCVKECLRVLKRGGLLSLAYINKLFIAAMFVNQNKDFYLDEEFIIKLVEHGTVDKDGCDSFLKNSYFFLPSEMETFMNRFNIDKVEHVAADGMGMFMNDMINGFTDKEFEVWMKYHLKTCSEPSTLGYSNHGLFVCKKR